jgi:isopentenyl diphosphate isomerase/L-lactate dehydrogenase-like FMN-dependent dehydrogenase
MTSLPIILKGIGNVEDVKLAVKNGVKAVILSNHGGRQLDTTEPALVTALQIHNENPELFEQIEILADGGVRYGADVLKLLALGVKAVGLGRPFMYANIFGQPGIERVIELLKHEIAIDAGNLGVPDLHEINADYVSTTRTRRQECFLCFKADQKNVGQLEPCRLWRINIDEERG